MVAVGVVYSAGRSSQSPLSHFCSLLPKEVQHHGLQVVSKGTDRSHQPVRTEAGISVHHTFCYIHLQRDTGGLEFNFWHIIKQLSPKSAVTRRRTGPRMIFCVTTGLIIKLKRHWKAMKYHRRHSLVSVLTLSTSPSSAPLGSFNHTVSSGFPTCWHGPSVCLGSCSLKHVLICLYQGHLYNTVLVILSHSTYLQNKTGLMPCFSSTQARICSLARLFLAEQTEAPCSAWCRSSL